MSDGFIKGLVVFNFRKPSHFYSNITVTYNVYEFTYLQLIEFNRKSG